MTHTQLSDTIENFDALNLEDKEFALEIFEKNVRESKREQLIKRVKEANQNYKTGTVKKGNLKDLFEDLEND
jgi:hypothetical protein